MKWVTRERPKIDRIACPWLIARFIDKEPEFLYVPSNQVLKVAAETGAVPLSEREAEVLGLLAQGMSNKDVAAALFISRATVKSHIENILRKLQASDRAAAVAEGFRRGLLRP